MRSYDLVCVGSGEVVEEKYTLACPNGHNSLLRARYREKHLMLRQCDGVFKYSGWLPVSTAYRTESCPIAFQSEGISKELGLDNLWIGFTGWYPERNARSCSASFKEMEALPTYSRLNDFSDDTIVIASAGNTGRAFAEIGNQIGRGCVVVVPDHASDRIVVTHDRGFAKLVTVKGDYADAIHVADMISSMEGFVPEGGAKNIARRDGMGTVLLEGVMAMERLPDHYFQAAGSGTGGIAAWEMSMRLLEDGRFGDRMPRLELSQNVPFVPMAKAWDAGRREILPEDIGDRDDVDQVYADVLTNRKPPYSVIGGVFDAMTATDGRFHRVTNNEARDAERLWMSIEDVKPNPAASVALASLMRSVDEGLVGRDSYIFLNMTGGGLERAIEDLSMETVDVHATVTSDPDMEELKEIVKNV